MVHEWRLLVLRNAGPCTAVAFPSKPLRIALKLVLREVRSEIVQSVLVSQGHLSRTETLNHLCACDVVLDHVLLLE